jgi:ATP-dependent RNA helicase DDX35
VLLGLLKKIQRSRPELRLIITSATLDADALKAFFETDTVAAKDSA